MKAIITSAIATTLALSSVNAVAATATFDASLVVQQAVSLVKDRNLDLGQITTDQTNDIVVNQADAGAAQFTISGTDGASVAISVANTNLTNNTSTIGVNFDAPASLTLTGGTATLNIGATALVSAATLEEGTYTATTNVDVVYN